MAVYPRSNLGSHRATLPRALRALAAFALGAFAVGAVAPPANAEYQEETGRPVTPGQPYGGKERPGDWLGSYLVDGKPVFCVAFELKAPDTNEKYQPGDELKTKWGDPLPAGIAANISYLLLRYGDTKDPDQAAALAHLLHSWTAAPRAGHDDLNPANDFRHIGYDAPYHLAKLPPEAREAVRALNADAEANRGPWTASVDAPPELRAGDAGDWTITVRNAKGKGVAKVPVSVELTGATLPDGSAKTTVTTGDDGTAKIKATPAGPHSRLVAGLSAPADKPYVRSPVNVDTQRVVSTGGEKHIKVEKAAKGQDKPGVVRVVKQDSRSHRGIAGAVLRLTGKDQTSALTRQDNKPFTGEDGKPVALTTAGEDGVATAGNLRAPSEVCAVEVAPPAGYEQAFDAANPPSACGTVRPGETLELTLTNVANQVPVAIPAGAPPVVMHAETVAVGSPAGFAVTGGLALAGSALVGFVARRRLRNSR